MRPSKTLTNYPYLLGELRLDETGQEVKDTKIRITHNLSPDERACVYKVLKHHLGEKVTWANDAQKTLEVSLI